MGAAVSRWHLAGLLAGLIALPGVGLAQSTGDAVPTITLPTTQVIGTSPVLGVGIDRDKVPSNVRSLNSSDLSREGSPDLVGTLQQRLPGVHITDTEGNPFAPDIQFRGFEASPVPGASQGLAIYQNGIRINEAYGDTVNWDLIPEVAIDRLNLITGNPVFGLNALGGALALEMKNGFTFDGLTAEIRGGSFGRRAGSLQYGTQIGNYGAYLAGEAINDNGWRDASASEIRRLYGDLGMRGDKAELHIAFTGASNRFGATAATPIELLDQRRASVYTTPQLFKNDVAMVSLAGSYQLQETLSLEGSLYYRAFRQHTSDGNTADILACNPGLFPGSLCLGDDTTPLTSTSGTPINNTLNGAVPGTVDRTRTSSDSVGGSLQMTRSAPLLERGNHLVLGGSLDRGVTRFNSLSELGTIGQDLYVLSTGTIISQANGDIAPVSVRTINNYYGLYATDTWDVTPLLSVTAGARFNLAEIRLEDQLGTSLNGDHWYSRLNPALGATYKLTPSVTLYGGYSEANRAPNPSELGCADPARPCLLANFVVSDPALKQVVSHTYEAGVRGGVALDEDRRLGWNLGLFRTDNSDDIINVASATSGRGFFQNAGGTRRQGLEAGVNFHSSRWYAYADYGFLDATFQSDLTLSSPNNPFADANGNITVRKGNHLPLIPQHRLKTGVDYNLTEDWKLGFDLIVVSDEYLRGDESNQNPKMPGYWVVNLHSSYTLSEHIELFGVVQNLFDQKYETFGTFFDPTQIPFLNLSDRRSFTPAAPLAAFVGLRATF